MKKTVLTNKELKSYVIQEHCHFFKKIFEEKYTADEKYLRIKNHYTSNYRGAAQNIQNSKHSISEEISVVFHNKLNYD